MAAKIDETAKFKAGRFWGAVEFPPPFGRPPAPEEQKIKELDAKTGASLKLTILNKDGRIWTMVAGGGASVIYADTITDLGSGHELANYGEYSGAPSDAFTYEYAKTVIQLMLDSKAEGKVCVLVSFSFSCSSFSRPMSFFFFFFSFLSTSLRSGSDHRRRDCELHGCRLHLQRNHPSLGGTSGRYPGTEHSDLRSTRWAELPGRTGQNASVSFSKT